MSGLAQAESFEKWAESQGEKIVNDLALKTGGYVFGLGRVQKAKGIIWSDLESIAIASPELNAAIQKFVIFYPEVLDQLAANFSSLPHQNSDLLVVPRLLVNRNALMELKKRLDNSKELADLKGGPAFREYFFEELVNQLDESFTGQAAKASPDKPLQVANKWIVGFNPNYKWRGVAGHYFVYSSYSRTSGSASSGQKKEGKRQSADLLGKCLSWLGELSEEQSEEWEAHLP